MESNEATFIYGLWDPRTLELRYIGKADNPEKRWFAHVSYARHGDGTHKSKWIRQLLEEGLLPSLDVLEEVPGDRWQEYEMAWIEEARKQGLNLTNTSDGGNGFTKGYKFPDEVRKRIGEKNRGKVMSPEARRKIGDGNRGKARSPEFLKRLSEARKGKKLSEEHKRKIGEAGRGRTHTEETREKLRRIRTGITLSREAIEKSAKSRIGLNHSEEHKRKIGEASKRDWERRKAAGYKVSDDARKKMSESAKNRSDETKKKISEVMKGKKHHLGHKHSEETKAKMRERRAGQSRPKHSEETKQKMRETWAKKKAQKNNDR